MQSPFERCERKLMNRMLGPANETKVKVCEVEINALIEFFFFSFIVYLSVTCLIRQ